MANQIFFSMIRPAAGGLRAPDPPITDALFSVLFFQKLAKLKSFQRFYIVSTSSEVNTAEIC